MNHLNASSEINQPQRARNTEVASNFGSKQQGESYDRHITA